MTCNSCKGVSASVLSSGRGVSAALRPLGVAALLWLLTFLLGKVAFIVLCHGAEPISVGDVAAILWHGLPMDLSTTAYLLLLPWLCAWIAGNRPSSWRWLRPLLLVFNALAAIVVAACIVGDIALYPFWGFKLDATIWTYIDSPRDAVASVSTTFVLLHLAAFILLAVCIFWCARLALPKILTDGKTGRQTTQHRTLLLPLLIRNLLFALVGIFLFILLRGGITESTMNVGNAYFSERQFLNHAAVNPAFSLLYSSQKAERFDFLYRSMPTEEAASLLAGLYPVTVPEGSVSTSSLETTEPGDSSSMKRPFGPSAPQGLLLTPRPSILLLFWEGCGGQLTASLGGPTGEAAITPNLDSLAQSGIFFSELRANSFRTDRGTLSTLSGHLAFPMHSLMKMAMRASHLPSIARTLQAAGYTTSFTYGGDLNFTNMKGYLLSTGFQRTVSEDDFSRSERATSKWGVCDSILFERLYEETATVPDGSSSPFFHAALTLSSHEPWDVPASFRRPSDPDEKVASFRYTDHHLGRLIRRLRSTSLWDNLLIIILPDHGVLAADVRDWQDPRFFHIPMMWTGGAVTAPATIDALMNQSDLPATLLAQLDLPHDDFPWSRDVLSHAYNRPFTYSTFNDGFAITVNNSQFTTVFFDNKAQRATTYGDSHLQDSLTHLGKAILQRSYDHLEQLR